MQKTGYLFVDWLPDSVYNTVDVNNSTQVAKMDARELRAEQIVARGKVRRGEKDGLWIVTGQGGHVNTYKYKVVINGDANVCTCDDFELRGKPCKHIMAVQEFIRREANPTEPVSQPPINIPRPSYPQAWAQYNAAQVEEKDRLQEMLAELCSGIDDAPVKKGPGRKPIPLRDQVFAAVFKIYVGFSARRFSCDLEEAQRRGHVASSIHFNSVLNALENPALTPILYDLIEKTALPLRSVESVFAVDSTGFMTSRHSRWFDHKYGVKVKADWVKAHAIIGVKTNVIVSAIILDQHAGDTTQLPKLVATAKELGFDIREVTADKVYCANPCFEAVKAVGGRLYAPFKANATGETGGLYQRAFHYFNLRRDEYLAHYHKRSNVESTFSMAKRKHGDFVRSKTDVAMRNETLAKFVCHNLCCLISAWHELGIESVFTPVQPNDESTAILPFLKSK